MKLFSSGSKAPYYIAALTSAMFWSTTGVISQLLFGMGVDPLTVVTFRALITFIVLAIYFLATNPKSLIIEKKELPFFAMYGFVGIAIFFSSLLYTIELTNVATAYVLMYTAPAFITIISRVLFKELLTTIKISALILTFVGCALVVEAYDISKLALNNIGLSVGLVCGLSYAMYSIFAKIAVKKVSRTITLFYSFMFGSLFLLILRPPWALFSLDIGLFGWFLIFLVSIFPTLFAYSLIIYALGGIEASKAAIVTTIEPAVAALLAYIFLQEALHLPQIIGFILVLIGVVMIPLSELNNSKGKGYTSGNNIKYNEEI